MMCRYPLVKDPEGRFRTDAAGRLAGTPLPCGQCLHCRINASRVWTHRIMLEASQHGDNIFWTGTFNEDHHPPDGSVNPDYARNFLRRLRRCTKTEFRYFLVGEYGDKSWRPHYHAIFFGLSAYHSRALDKAWSDSKGSIGFQSIDEVNNKSAAYVAGYAIKKLTRKIDPRLNGLSPEFMRSSRKGGGIGLSAIKKIADTLKKNEYWKPVIINELKHGKKSWPLGRYLTDKLSAELGITQEQKDLKFATYQAEQFDIMNSKSWWHDGLMNDKRQKRRQQEWRQRNYSRTRDCEDKFI